MAEIAPRLYLQNGLVAGAEIPLPPPQAHFLRNVLRLETGATLAVFNGEQGEWLATIDCIGKKAAAVTIQAQRRPPEPEPDVWLLFAPIKRTPIDFIAQKATELGVSALQPIFTQRTIVTRVNEERLLANVTEAAEQTGRLSLPVLLPATTLPKRLTDFPPDRKLLLCDERGDAKPILEVLQESPKGEKWAILIGCEGGFTSQEFDLLERCAFVQPCTLGKRILRADTAAIAALACFQMLNEK
jgi:16S rRNA (uracil1498-N3)-methyltransferase